jgi:hypothetical protein
MTDGILKGIPVDVSTGEVMSENLKQGMLLPDNSTIVDLHWHIVYYIVHLRLGLVDIKVAADQMVVTDQGEMPASCVTDHMCLEVNTGVDFEPVLQTSLYHVSAPVVSIFLDRPGILYAKGIAMIPQTRRK